MNRLVVALLQVGIGFTVLAGVFAQVVVVPGAIAEESALDPFVGYFRGEFTAVGILGIACVQVVLVSTFVLLTMTQDGRIFSRRAFMWVNSIIGAIFGASALCVVVFVAAMTVPPASDGDGMSSLGYMLSGFGGAGVCLGLAMIVFVLRGLLSRSINLREELAQVV
ncbi:DUF2975 domain-containing protein [Stackebrandtia soli]|uniref:DUF2975 domain-containing protein n=1 Tax=Stackebrandtia soli TaxID=1892856 RepID=UPI0039EA4DDD